MTPTASAPVESRTKIHPITEQLNQIFSGALSAAITCLICQPFDVLKIRFQLQVEPLHNKAGETSKYTSIPQAVRKIYREEGRCAFWKGHNPSQASGITYGICNFWTYEQFRFYLQQTEYFANRPNAANFFAGTTAGLVGVLFAAPMDVIHTRLIAADASKGYGSASRALPTIIREEGFRGMYRGVSVGMIQGAPLMGLNFMIYRFLSQSAMTFFEVEQREQVPIPVLIVMGGCSGVISKSIVYPLDLVRKRIHLRQFESNRQTFGQTSSCRHIFLCLSDTFRAEGFRGLYKGMSPTLLKSCATMAIHFSTYDKLKQIRWFG